MNDFDHPDNFDSLFKSGSITTEHYEMVNQNKHYLDIVGRKTSTAFSSTSGNFSSTSLEFVSKKLKFLELSNVELIPGDISYSISKGNYPDKIAAIFLDADLYDPYNSVLNQCWKNVTPGGIIWLDEYFSLKFPGPRIAVDQFMATVDDAELLCVEAPLGEFVDYQETRTMSAWTLASRGQLSSPHTSA